VAFFSPLPPFFPTPAVRIARCSSNPVPTGVPSRRKSYLFIMEIVRRPSPLDERSPRFPLLARVSAPSARPARCFDRLFAARRASFTVEGKRVLISHVACSSADTDCCSRRSRHLFFQRGWTRTHRRRFVASRTSSKGTGSIDAVYNGIARRFAYTVLTSNDEVLDYLRTNIRKHPVIGREVTFLPTSHENVFHLNPTNRIDLECRYIRYRLKIIVY